MTTGLRLAMRSGDQQPSSIHIASTFGDPTSIGPEVGRDAIQKFLKKFPSAHIHLFCPQEFALHLPRVTHYDSLSSTRKFIPGRPSIASGKRALADLTSATAACLSGSAQALVTGPVDKAWCAKTAASFTGHTGFLEKATLSKGTTMLLEAGNFRVSLVTVHIPIRMVGSSITKSKVLETILRTHDYLRLNIRRPVIAVCGLNPHAGDRGLLGNEEIFTILPAIRMAQKRGIDARGPFSADSIFQRSGDFDAIVCMYHDQGLIPIKTLHFYDAINITLGLPFLRTSVDHGTAFDIAGKRKASSTSYAQALERAYQWVQRTNGKSPRRYPARHSNSRRKGT